MLLLLLAACGPEHHPDDLAEIDRLKVQIRAQEVALNQALVANEEFSVQEQVDLGTMQALLVLAGAYLEVEPPPEDRDLLTVCFVHLQVPDTDPVQEVILPTVSYLTVEECEDMHLFQIERDHGGRPFLTLLEE